jgi:hypothetical protein
MDNSSAATTATRMSTSSAATTDYENLNLIDTCRSNPSGGFNCGESNYLICT